MRVFLTGTYKYRVRVNFLFFCVVRPWKTEKIDVALEVPKESTSVRLKDFTLSLATTDEGLQVALDFLKYNVYKHTFKPSELDAIKDGIAIKAEPIKGCIIDVVVALR